MKSQFEAAEISLRRPDSRRSGRSVRAIESLMRNMETVRLGLKHCAAAAAAVPEPGADEGSATDGGGRR